METNKDKRTFEIKKYFENKNSGKIIEISKQEELEIEWNGNKGEIKGGEKIITFKKDNEEYPIVLKVELVDSFWKTRLVNYLIDTPEGSPHFLTGVREKNSTRMFTGHVKLIETWKAGRIMAAAGLLLLVASFIGLVFLMKKKGESRIA